MNNLILAKWSASELVAPARLSHGEERVKFPSGFSVAYSAAEYLIK